MWCKYIIEVRGIVIRELKHQTFLIHVRHGWPRRTGSGTRFVCKMQLLSKTSWNHHERRQNNSDENAFQRFALSFVSFLRRKHDFRRGISTFVWRILFKEPRIWTSAGVSTWELAFWSPWPQLMAVRLQTYFRLASVVPRSSKILAC